MDIVGFITSQNLFDILFLFLLLAAFILGFVQGTIRRLLGIASILFSFLVAANVRDTLGSFLASNWTQFPAEYAYMLGFLAVFVVGSVAFSLIIQGFYKRTPLLANATFVDEIIGGVLGILQTLLIVGCLILILDSFFLLPGHASDQNEIPFLRDLFNAYDHSGVADLFRTTLIPALLAVVGLLVPDDLESPYPHLGQ